MTAHRVSPPSSAAFSASGFSRLAGIAAAIFFLAAPGRPADFLAHFGFDESAYSEAGREGLRQIFSGQMFNASLPLAMAKARYAPDAKREAESGHAAGSPGDWFYREGALPPPPGAADPGLPLGLSKFERNGKPLASINCFLCHAGAVNGMAVAGLGSNSTLQPSKRPDPSRGDNYGQYAVWLYAARLADPANTGLLASRAKTELAALVESTPLPPIQPMPWWLMKYKVRDYWYGDGGPSDAAHFSLNFTIASADVNERHPAHVEATAKALAFARETVSPLFPGTLDPDRVRLGSDLFHGRTAPASPGSFKTCNQCHGDYSKKSSAPDWSKPGGWDVDYDGSEALRDAGTDPAYNEVIAKFEPVIEHIAKLKDYYEAKGTPELAPIDRPLKGKGYVPPPLVGVWAAAPYFHNGSVPTIEAVLNSAERPAIWARDPDPRAYDLEKIGLPYKAVTRADYEAAAEKARTAGANSKAALDQSFVYDTEAFGRGNEGHPFGDGLNAEERAAVLEFLKSLSGPDM